MPAAALAEPQPRDDRLSRRNFERLAKVISGYSGIKMPPNKVTMLEGRLRRRLRATGLATFDAYCDHLFEEDGLETEFVHLIDAVTTNKTDFFREPQHFDFLRDQALPKLLTGGARKLRLWSAACSTGAEPYTMAMVVDAFREQQGARFDYEILATDLSTEVLGAAHLGVFDDDMIAPVPPEMRHSYLRLSRDPARRQVRVCPELRAKVGFARLNLMDEAYRIGEPVDAIFCRNVMIYFDKPTQAGVLKRLCDTLKPGGYLFIGHSETIAGVPLPVEQVSSTIFRKR